MSFSILSERVNRFLDSLPGLTIAVLGDLFLDRYLDIDGELSEPSLETGLEAYQVIRVRSDPGAAGTVVNNLAAFGIGRIIPLTIIGDDGEGYELRQALSRLQGVELSGVLNWPQRRTPTYTKPMLHQPGQAARELNRLDIHNRQPLPAEAEEQLMELLDSAWAEIDGLIVLDQVRFPNCGVITERLRNWLVRQSGRQPQTKILVDSRERIGSFSGMYLKPNARECRLATGIDSIEAASEALARRAGMAVFCTSAEEGIYLAEPGQPVQQVPGFPVQGPIDPVGAGDSCNAAILSALAMGFDAVDAAALGNLVASITVQQLGTTGTATPTQIRQRLVEIEKM